MYCKQKPISGIIKSHGNNVFFQEFIWDYEKPIVKSKPTFGQFKDFENKLENSFHFDCDNLIKVDKIFEAYPCPISVAELSIIYYKDWINHKKIGFGPDSNKSIFMWRNNQIFKSYKSN